MKKILYFTLKLLSIAVIKKYQPKIIGITGSVGKTSSKEAIFSVIKKNWRVRRSIKNYNNEIGVPLTILNQDTGGKSIVAWIKIVIAGLKLLVFKNKKYPQILVLEMGADKPGDIKYLTSIAPPDISVLIAIGRSHLQNFGKIEETAKEKASILTPLTKKGFAILNNDDKRVAALAEQTKGNVLTYGKSEDSDIQIDNIKIIKQKHIYGTSFDLNFEGGTWPVFLPQVLGKQHALAIASACTVGLALGMDPESIIKNLAHYQAARGRTNVLLGIKNSLVIDDSYNSSPMSSKMVIDTLAEMKTEGSKIIVFGDMLELGASTEEQHQKIGKYIADTDVDYLFVVGERARDVRRGAIKAGMSEDKIYHFPSTTQAGLFLQDRIKEGDVILVKGSRGMKMEQVVYEIMARPWEADDFLVGPVR
ncbi:UDP-N-acetylmuramoyl-tripeptide--D-alanyl-D-alanine ligase [bacterium]|mgnify:CR=1 FL=1|nr:UDP-N-acetylmuramoyl-tripeptide--D-alanyl-D-alanine ligase [bacterium]MBT4447327.1 UDP-N-acetylmuramoyl-tripeptide--D-alanyl-D-alanine ligase [Candidatus Komeilibacteria bacterium]